MHQPPLESKTNSGARTAYALGGVAAAFLGLAVLLLANLWGHPPAKSQIPLVDPAFLETTPWRRTYADLVKAKEDLSDYDCYGCHEENTPPPLRFDDKGKLLIPSEHANIVMGHSTHDRNNLCFNCHNEANLLTLQIRDGTTVKFDNIPPLCGSCRDGVWQHAVPVREPALLFRAALFGSAATLAGAAIYYAVMRFFNLEIGLVAILSGWMIGKAARVGAAGRGGRLLQVGAAVLTYLSVALAYVPFALQGAAPGALSTIAVGILALTLPVLVIVGSMPSGLISAAIIGFGMVQAWQLTAANRFVFEGPFRVGGAPR